MKRAIQYCCALFCFALISCENDTKEVERITSKKEIYPTLTGRGVDADFRDSGIVRIKMQAGILKRYEFNVTEPYYEADSGLKITFFDKNGKQVSTLTSRYGVFYERTRRMEVRYNVVVENEEGKRLETEKLKWRDRDSIRNEGQVVMYENNKKLIGKKLIASEDFSHMEIEDYTFLVPVDDFEKEEKK